MDITEGIVQERSGLLVGEKVTIRGDIYRVAKVMEKSILLKKDGPRRIPEEKGVDNG